MNIYDVSNKAGVSIATVSRVLNGNMNVSDKTRQKVLDAIKELDYTPNIFARGLGLNTMKAIGIMCADSSDLFLANAVFYLEKELKKNGYDSFLCCTGYETETKQSYLSLLLSKRVDAIILVGSTFVEATRKMNQYIIDASVDIPVMIMNGYIQSDNIYCTLCDDQISVCTAMNSLIESGCRKTLFLHGTKTYSALRKLAGYKDALNKAGFDFIEDMVISCPKDIHKTAKLLEDIYDNEMAFDSVIASEDVYAVGALKFAESKGISVPDDFSIIGYNNSMYSICCNPELSTIDNHVETLSLTTVQTLMRVLDGNHMPNIITLSNELIYRSTTKMKNDI